MSDNKERCDHCDAVSTASICDGCFIDGHTDTQHCAACRAELNAAVERLRGVELE